MQVIREPGCPRDCLVSGGLEEAPQLRSDGAPDQKVAVISASRRAVGQHRESTDDDERLALLIEELPQQAKDFLDVQAMSSLLWAARRTLGCARALTLARGGVYSTSPRRLGA